MEGLFALRPWKTLRPEGVNTALQMIPDREFACCSTCSVPVSVYLLPSEVAPGDVTVIQSQVETKFADNLQPINLLSATLIILERLVQRRLHGHLKRFNVVVPEQFGFRARHFSTHQLMGFVAVSYTHLDVYKRQGNTSGIKSFNLYKA